MITMIVMIRTVIILKGSEPDFDRLGSRLGRAKMRQSPALTLNLTAE